VRVAAHNDRKLSDTPERRSAWLGVAVAVTEAIGAKINQYEGAGTNDAKLIRVLDTGNRLAPCLYVGVRRQCAKDDIEPQKRYKGANDKRGQRQTERQREESIEATTQDEDEKRDDRNEHDCSEANIEKA
jgi:hypothetical protein